MVFHVLYVLGSYHYLQKNPCYLSNILAEGRSVSMNTVQQLLFTSVFTSVENLSKMTITNQSGHQSCFSLEKRRGRGGAPQNALTQLLWQLTQQAMQLPQHTVKLVYKTHSGNVKAVHPTNALCFCSCSVRISQLA